MFIYCEATNRRSLGPSPFPEFQTQWEPRKPSGWPGMIFGGKASSAEWTNGGKWLMSVAYRPDSAPGGMIGFYHAQDHRFANGEVTNAAGKAYKTVGVAYSEDYGRTFVDGGLILFGVGGKPFEPAWGGVGDQYVLWDWQQQHWKMYFKEGYRLGVAISTDPRGAPGTWWKWNGREGEPVPQWRRGEPRPAGYDSPGLQGGYTGLPGLWEVPGSNPHVHWNTLLQKWVMVWNSWASDKVNGPSLYISASVDGLNWEKPRSLVRPRCSGSTAWHGTVISREGGSEFAGASGRLYHSDCWRKHGFNLDKQWNDYRDWVSRTINFERMD